MQGFPKIEFVLIQDVLKVSLSDGRRMVEVRKEGKSFFGGKCVLGGFDNRKQGVLYSGSKEEIREFTDRLIEETGTEGFIVGADCTLPGNVSREHFKWVAERVKELARSSSNA